MKRDTAALGALTGAATLGAYLASQVFREQETRKGVALVHGPLAATGLVLLTLASRETGWRKYKGNVVLFGMAALGGVVLISRDLLGRRVPRWLAAAHGTIAASGLVWTAIGVARSRKSAALPDLSHELGEIDRRDESIARFSTPGPKDEKPTYLH